MCDLELEGCLDIAERLVQISQRTGVGIVFKASFDKANRSSISAFAARTEEGLRILERVRAESGLPIMTDVHESGQAARPQVPSWTVCRSQRFCAARPICSACAETGKPVNVKKGQFLSPDGDEPRGREDSCLPE